VQDILKAMNCSQRKEERQRWEKYGTGVVRESTFSGGGNGKVSVSEGSQAVSIFLLVQVIWKEGEALVGETF
jgi:hypothetical protein